MVQAQVTSPRFGGMVLFKIQLLLGFQVVLVIPGALGSLAHGATVTHPGLQWAVPPCAPRQVQAAHHVEEDAARTLWL